MKIRYRAALGLCLLVTAAFAAGCFPQPPANEAPVAIAAATPDSGQVPLEVQFSSDGSNDPDGSITSYAWDFDDGATSTEANPVHTYTVAGEYTATLRVTDNSNTTATASVVISVTEVPDDPNGRYVATTGSDSGDCSTSAEPCATVNYAVSRAEAGNTVHVAAGEYPEIVAVDKALTFEGANAGVPAGADAEVRGAESVVKGFRNPGTWVPSADPVGDTQIDVTIDGFRIEPMGDAAMIAASQEPLVWLRGGSDAGVSIVNNVLFGADTFVPACAHTCTEMADAAITTYSGTVLLEENHVENFRRPVLMTQSFGAPATEATVSDNAVVNSTSKAIGVGGVTGTKMPGATVSGNVLTTASTSTPGGVVVTNGSNLITGNTIDGHSSAVWIDICKKFVTRDNVVTGNTLTNNRWGLYTGVSQGGACQDDTQPVPDGGDINGLVATDNNISGNTVRGVQISLGIGWGSFTPIYPDGPIDLTCNWWGDPSGPSNATYNPGGTGQPLWVTDAGTATIDVIPFRTGPAPDGPCDGGVAG